MAIQVYRKIIFSLGVMYFFTQVTKVRPSDKDAKLKYNECNKIVKKIAFEKAISVEDNKKNVADSINLEAMSKLGAVAVYIII